MYHIFLEVLFYDHYSLCSVVVFLLRWCSHCFSLCLLMSSWCSWCSYWQVVVWCRCSPWWLVLVFVSVFGDKSQMDLHGALSLTPLIFTLSLFNRTARNRVSFWRPMVYVPNLSFGKGESDSALSVTKLQDEHICLAATFQSVIEINKRGGMSFSYGGKLVCAKFFTRTFV